MWNFHHPGDKAKAREAWRAWSINRTKPERASTRPIRSLIADDDTTEILIYEEIGTWGISAKDFKAALDAVATPKVCVRISSPGGDVFDGLAIYNALKTSRKNVSCVIDGLAASAASFIAMAGQTVSIHPSAMVMVHRAWGIAIGNEGDMSAMGETLRKIDGQLAGIYAAKSGASVSAMRDIMIGESDGTWFTAEEAADAGLVDEIIAGADNKANARFDLLKAKPTPRDCERALRDAGVPRELAKAIVARGWRAAADQRDAEGDVAELISALRAHTTSLSTLRKGQ